jgi:hypothetical protein
MIRGFRPLPFLRKDASEREQPADSQSIAEPTPNRILDDLALDDAPVGPHLLRPSASYLQVIFDPTPIWAQPRSAAPEPAPDRASVVNRDVGELTATAGSPNAKPEARPRKRRASGAGAPAPDGPSPPRIRKPRSKGTTAT